MYFRNEISKEELAKKIEEIQPLTHAFELLNVHTVITDSDAHILYMNKVAEVKTGYSLEESIGKNPGDLWGGHESTVFFDDMWKKIKSHKQSYRGKVKNIRKDGTEYWQELNITPVLDEQGEIEYFISVEPDITSTQLENKELAKKIDLLYETIINREIRIKELRDQVETLKSTQS
jgi:PAS domain S-box-containing protein